MFTNLIANSGPTKGLPTVTERVSLAPSRSRRHRRRQQRTARFAQVA